MQQQTKNSIQLSMYPSMEFTSVQQGSNNENLSLLPTTVNTNKNPVTIPALKAGCGISFGSIFAMLCTMSCLLLGLQFLLFAVLEQQDAQFYKAAQNCTMVARNDTEHACYKLRHGTLIKYACVDVAFTMSFVANESLHSGTFFVYRNVASSTATSEKQYANKTYSIGQSFDTCWYQQEEDEEAGWQVTIWSPFAPVSTFWILMTVGIALGCFFCCLFSACCAWGWKHFIQATYLQIEQRSNQ